VLQFKDIQQNTEEWDLLRVGKITSSALSCAMANYGKAFGDPAKKYAVSIALGQITGKVDPLGYSNEHMERGHEDEPLARMAYESQTFTVVKNGGFFFDGDQGCSPDGLIATTGAVEIKSAIPSIHFERIRKQSFDSSYKWQLINNMKLPGLEWIDFVSYCKSFPEDRKLFMVRLYAERFKAEYKMIDTRLSEFRELIEETKQTILNSDYQIEAIAA
jgi:hypothetical protein